MTATYYVNLFEEVLEGADPITLFICNICNEKLMDDRDCEYTKGTCDDCCNCGGHN
jgi:predicted metal-binding protein